MAIPQSFLQELTARTDLVELVGRHVQLKKAGANYSGLCPFHAEKSPSFTVSPAKQFFHCFGCGKHGDAIGFLMEHSGLSFMEAVQDLAQQYGLQVPSEELSPQERQRAASLKEQQVSLSEVIEKASKAYIQHLKKTPHAVAYLKMREVSGEIAKRFALGYAPGGWRNLASVFPDYNDPRLVESGMVISNAAEVDAPKGSEEKRYDRFRDRIMFPIRNVKGEFIGFGGRVLGDEKPKYLNSPETPLFSKGLELYGLFEGRNAIRDMGYALVTEGYMDVVALAQLGFANAVATLGTACTREHAQKLFRFTDAVVFSFDGDAAGRRAARRALEAALGFATDVRSIKFLFLPEEHDPDSFIRERGAQAFAQCVSDAMPLSRFLVESAREGCNLQEAEGRALFANHAQGLWKALPQGVLQRQVLKDLANLIQLTPEALQELWTPRSERTPNLAAKPWPSQPKTHRTSHKAMVSREGRAVCLLLSFSSLWDQLTPHQHQVLASLPQPYGTVVTWLERLLQEHGRLDWPTISQQMQGHPVEAHVQALMDTTMVQTIDEHGDGLGDVLKELQHVLHRIEIDQLKAQETLAIQQSGQDPNGLKTYRSLQAQRLALEAQLHSPDAPE
ncbi:MAG: DNA primase [Betaproteobacteria bacterium]|nr:DNA primase [Betaproteobacteria bacterium]NBY71623.1 DNA primase [Betaproteobacteria bacterium]